MWRAFFLALGINLLILGGECLFVEQVVFAKSNSKKSAEVVTPDNIYAPASFSQASSNSVESKKKKSFRPKDWMPWSLLAAGSIIVIYTYSLPRRKS